MALKRRIKEVEKFIEETDELLNEQDRRDREFNKNQSAPRS